MKPSSCTRKSSNYGIAYFKDFDFFTVLLSLLNFILIIMIIYRKCLINKVEYITMTWRKKNIKAAITTPSNYFKVTILL